METVIQQRPRKMVSTQEGEERERERERDEGMGNDRDAGMAIQLQAIFRAAQD